MKCNKLWIALGLSALSLGLVQKSELTLKEVADQIPDGPISKSGVNHRFKKLHELAENLRD